MKRLFLVDDDPDQCILVTKVFNEIAPEMEVECIGSGEKLLERLQSRFLFPQLILLDFQMDVKNGIEVLRELKQDEDFRQIPVIMFSGSPKPEIVSECYNLNAHSFIRKPGDYEELLKVSQTIRYLLQTKFKIEPIKKKRPKTKGTMIT